MNSVLIIIFSFNRALQLECLLNTILVRFIYPEFKIAVVYHHTETHKASYAKLIGNFQDNRLIKFYLINENTIFIKDTLPLLFSIRNLARFIKHPYLRKKRDNFKELTEKIISKSQCEFTFFLTDDGYFYKDVIVPDTVFDLIRINPMQNSYRMYVGDNLFNFPEKLTINDGVYNWNYNDPELHSHWAYPFSVDATIYDSKSVLKVIKPVLYHMPTTLEGYIMYKCKKKGIFLNGYSSKESNYVGTFINRVASIGNNKSGNIDADLLKDYFMEGYSLNYKFKVPPHEHAFIPDSLILNHPEKEKITINLQPSLNQLENSYD